MTGERALLAIRLGLGDAVTLGLASMIGAGVFAAIGPAAAVAGSGLLVGLAIAAVVAYANATSSAQLAAVYPEAGGTYVYGRERLGPLWGYLAGWSFVVGKTASLTAMAVTFGVYAFPAHERVAAVLAVIVMTGVNYAGVRKTARLSRIIVAIILASLGVLVVAALTGPDGSTTNFDGLASAPPWDVLQAAGLLFFAFAGYARIATLGEEVIEPRTTIPKAIPLALGLALAVYALVAFSAIYAIGPEDLAAASAPLAAAAEGRFGSAPTLVRAGGAIASLGVLVSLLAGVSRTSFAMARNGELPRPLAAVHPVHRTPYVADLVVGTVVATVAAFADLREAIGFSSFAVLTYYAIANASAYTQPDSDRRWPKWLQVVGMVGCVTLALSLPAVSIGGGAIFLAAGVVVWWIRHRPDD